MKTFLIVIAIALVILVVAAWIASAYILSYISRRSLFPMPKALLSRFQGSIVGNENVGETNNDYEKWALEREIWLQAQKWEDLSLTSTDGYKLHAGYLSYESLESDKFSAKCERKGLILASHGSRSSGMGEFRHIARFLNEQGFDLLLVDHRACGKSEGSYMGYGYFESKDTMLWLNYARKCLCDDLPVFLYGISMGAATVLMMSSLDLPDNVKGIVADCSYTSAWNEFEYQLRESFHRKAFPVLYLVNCLSIMLAGYSFKKASPVECVKAARVPILFIHGEKDDYVPSCMVHKLYDACTSSKDLLVVPHAMHANSYQTNPDIYQAKLVEFFNRQRYELPLSAVCDSNE